MEHITEKPSLVQEDSISICEIFSVLCKQKVIIITTLVFILLLATSYILLVSPVYESQAIISIGKVTQTSIMQTNAMQANTMQIGILEEPQLMVQRIKERYKVGELSENSKNSPKLVTVDIDKRANSNIVILKARANSPQEAQAFLTSVVKPLIDEHQNIYSKSKLIQDNKILMLEQELKEIDDGIKDCTTQSRLIVNKDAAMAALLIMEKTRLLDRRTGLYKEIAEAKMAMSEVNTKSTELLREPTITENPTKSKVLIIALSTVLGLFLGIMAALVKEYLVSRRKILKVS